MQKVSGGWRIAAIICGIGLLMMLGLLVYGINITNATDTCNYYCVDKGYESFYYNYQIDKCDCYIGADIKETIAIRR